MMLKAIHTTRKGYEYEYPYHSLPGSMLRNCRLIDFRQCSTEHQKSQ